MIDRRKFIKGSAALTALSLSPFSTVIAQQSVSPEIETNPKIFPKRLKKGNVIGLVTPGGTISKEQLDKTIEKLEGFGFRTYHTDSVLSEYGYFAGTDNERADELMHMFTNRKVDAILCVRGGYGSIRILDLLDYDQIQQNPKMLIGYSDITALLTTIYQRTGLITFHGPLGISSFNEFTYECFNRVLINPKNHYKYSYEREADTKDNPEYDIYTINKGKAEGELIGGNISVLDSMIGSAYEPDFENKIVYLEEIGEQTYRVDKMLFHLLYATNLKKAAGIVMGVFDDCNLNTEKPSLSLKQAIVDLLMPLGIPISYGLSFGHIDTMITIPNGIKARMNGDKNTLKLLEKAVS
ncbi:MAG: LD-carboxypeptidase [Bacteroidales bacterium]|nr:LD-carboxypeptidase [Bacteroidales bacterium]